MTHYYQQIKKIKEFDSVDYIKFKYQNKFVTFRLVDTSEETIRNLTNWRKNNRFMFGTNFEMSEKRTLDWIKNNLKERKDWILFIINIDGKQYGNMGTDLYDEKNNSAILDNIMKEPSFNYPGLMTIVEKVYLKWMFDVLKLSKISGDLFTDNYKMMNLHYKCGWKITNSIPLKKIYTEDGWKWEEMKLQSEEDYGERYFWHLEITKEKLMEKMGDIEYEILY